MVIKSGNYVDKDEMFTFAVLSIESFFFSSDSYTLLGLSTNSVYIFNKSSLEKDFPGQAQILFHPSSREANTKQVWSQLVMTYPSSSRTFEEQRVACSYVRADGRHVP